MTHSRPIRDRCLFDLYRRIISLYPLSFRNRFECEMIRTYLDMTLYNRTDNSLPEVFVFWFQWILDLFASIIHERLFDWRNNMKILNLILKTIGGFILAFWIIIVGMGFGRALFNWPTKDPAYLLLGESFSSLALTAFNSLLLFGPLLVLLLFLIPSTQIRVRPASGDLLEIRLLRTSSMSLSIILGSAFINLIIFVFFVGARLL